MSVGPRIESNVYKVITPSGREVYPPEGRSWVFKEDRLKEMLVDNRIWFGRDGNNVPSVKRFLFETKQGIVALTMWFREEVGDSQEGKREVKAINSDSVFSTPKQERLIERILSLGSKEGDLILDSFLGSRVIIMTEANSSVKSKVLKLLPKLKTEETDSLCVA